MKLKNLISLITDFTNRMNEDHVSAYGAMTAFFTFVSIFPFLSLFITFTKEVPTIKNYAFAIMNSALPLGKENEVILDVLEQIYQAPVPGLLSISIISILWSSSKWMFSIIQGLDCIYEIKEKKGYLFLRLLSIFYSTIFIGMLILLMILFVFGNQIHKLVITHFAFLAPISGLILRHREIIAFFVLSVFFVILYTLVPNRKSTFRKEAPGAVFTASAWILVSLAFSIYIDYFPIQAYAYGSLNGIILFFLWLYTEMYILFLGAEFNKFLSDHKWRNIVRLLFPQYNKEKKI